MAQTNGSVGQGAPTPTGPLQLTTDDLLLLIGRLTVENQALRAWLQRLESAQANVPASAPVGAPQA